MARLVQVPVLGGSRGIGEVITMVKRELFEQEYGGRGKLCTDTEGRP